MLAVALKDLYAEEAKQRQGTRTDLGKKIDKSKAGRSAQKAADDMGVSHQTVIYAEKVAKKGIPELAGLVNSGKVAVSAAANATSLAAESQQMVVAKVEEKLKDGKHANIPAIIRDLFPKSPENDAEERFTKSKKNLAACLKLLEGIEATQSHDKLAEMLELLGKLTARLKEIGAKPPDQTSRNAPIASDDLQTETKETSSTSSDNSEPTNYEDADVLDGDGEELVNDSSDSTDSSADMPEGWEEYQEAIERENENQGEW
jgi:RNA polymerase-interacting CarD/CdnL/TRCF family regulator